MAQTVQRLFVGGSKDGQWGEHHADLLRLFVREEAEVDAGLFAEANVDEGGVWDVASEVYIAHRLYLCGVVFEAWVHSEIKGQKAMDRATLRAIVQRDVAQVMGVW